MYMILNGHKLANTSVVVRHEITDEKSDYLRNGVSDPKTWFSMENEENDINTESSSRKP